MKLSESLDSMEISSRKTQQVIKKDILRSQTSRASPLRCHGSFHRGILGRKYCLLFIVKKHWNPYLRLRPPRWSSLRMSSVGLKHHYQTWTLVDLPPRKVIAVVGYTRVRKNEHGAVYRLKSLLVAKGHSQKPRMDYNDTFMPVGGKVILRFVLSFDLHLWYELYQLDIDTDYLYGNLKETKYMIQPEGFDDGSGRVCLLQKCIYGLKQSWREWYFWLSNFQKSIGFEICPKEPCLLLKDKVLLFIYADDILVMSKTKRVYERFPDLLKTEFKIKELGKPKHILGVRVEFVKNGISLS